MFIFLKKMWVKPLYEKAYYTLVVGKDVLNYDKDEDNFLDHALDHSRY